MKPIKKWRLPERQSESILDQLLDERGYRTEVQKEEFLKPIAPEKLIEDEPKTGLALKDLKRALEVIEKAVAEGRPIIIHGDYDVDGLCATAILWQTLYQDLGCKNCRPFIPNRFDHGYGLSLSSVDSISNLRDLGDLGHLKPLLITVDCGITAAAAVEYAQQKGFEVLVIDHHARPAELPDCEILWSDKMCAAGLAWVLSQKISELEIRELGEELPNSLINSSTNQLKYLDLAALATIADLQSLTGFNRGLVKYGLEKLNQTGNVGLKALMAAAGIEGRKIGAFEVGWVLAPRLNASGRLENALDSLRLLCTHDQDQAHEIAQSLNRINSERQELTRSMVTLAIDQIHNSKFQIPNSKITVVAHEDFHEGIIGLVAGKLVQEYGLPAVVISKGDEFSKASARSVTGFDIVEFLRSLGDHFEDIGGHAGAAGFTLRTEKIGDFLSAVKGQMSDVVLPEPVLKIDAEIKFEDLNLELYEKISRLEPFGLGNPEPVFLLKEARVAEARTVGTQGQHLKLRVTSYQSPASVSVDCIGFDFGDRLNEAVVGGQIDLVFYLSEDRFNGRPKISLKVKDFQASRL